jgi:Cu/Ag efflux protein CusF
VSDAVALSFGVAGHAADPTAAPAATPSAAPSAAPALTDGELRKVDLENRKLTLKHGEIKNLGMPGMTFQVKDAALLQGVKAGDKVRFVAERVNGELTVTQIQPASWLIWHA